MRILFVCCPELCHLHPLFPLAAAAVEAGHEVRFASGASVAARINDAGYASVDVGPPGVEEMFAALVERVGGEPGAGLPPEAILDWFFPNLFAATVAPMVLPDLMDAMDALAVLRSAEVPLALVHQIVAPNDHPRSPLVERHDHGAFLGQLREQRLEGRERSPGQRARGQLGDPGCRRVLRTSRAAGRCGRRLASCR